jgi:hypothetical protein
MVHKIFLRRDAVSFVATARRPRPNASPLSICHHILTQSTMAVLQEQPHPASLPQRRTTTSNAPIVDFETAPSEYVSFFCGLIAGVAQAGLFNPYDRALYLSVKHKRPFLSSLNFQSPYQGFLQSVGGRALSGGL